jgi:hypothetical protein
MSSAPQSTGNKVKNFLSRHEETLFRQVSRRVLVKKLKIFCPATKKRYFVKCPAEYWLKS